MIERKLLVTKISLCIRIYLNNKIYNEEIYVFLLFNNFINLKFKK